MFLVVVLVNYNNPSSNYKNRLFQNNVLVYVKDIRYALNFKRLQKKL